MKNNNHKMNRVQKINETEFDARVLQSDRPVLVGFLSDWSQACARFEPVLEEVAAACAEQAKVYRVEVDDNPDLGSEYGIQSVPTLIYFVGGAIRAKIIGTVSARAILAKLPPVAQPKNPARKQVLNQATTNLNSEI